MAELDSSNFGSHAVPVLARQYALPPNMAAGGRNSGMSRADVSRWETDVQDAMTGDHFQSSHSRPHARDQDRLLPQLDGRYQHFLRPIESWAKKMTAECRSVS